MKKLKIATIFVGLLLHASMVKTVHGNIDVLLNLISYSNPTGVKNTRECCDLVTDQFDCFSNPCDTIITGCIKSNSQKSQCDIGQFSTEEYVDTNNITFGSNLGSNLKNPLVYTFDNTWTGVVYIQLQADDMDKAAQVDFIDSLSDTVQISPSKNNQSHTNLSRVLHSNISHIAYTISVYCSKNYYGQFCETFCQETKNQFICNDLGEKVCDKYWYGLNCSDYCQDQDSDQNGHYQCNLTGQKVCSQNWYGPECKTFCKNGSNYECNNHGRKVCKNFWYGKDCDISCNPSVPSNGHFTCNQNGSKICDHSYYGTDCTVLCQSNWNGNYTCNNLGEKICFSNYYGKECDKYCYAKSNDNFICNQAGEKVCKKHYYGEDCNIFVPNLPNKEATCSIFGSTTLQTFDNHYYTLNGKCTYKIAGDCKDDTFSIHFKLDSRCSKGESYYCKKQIIMYMGGREVRLTTKDLISVNNETILMPYSKGGIEITRLQGTNFIAFSGWKGVKLLWDEDSIFLQLMPNYANKTCGLCGNYNGNPLDDMNDIKRVPIKNIEKFVASWQRLLVGESCPPQSPPLAYSLAKSLDTENYAKTACNTLKSSFAACHQDVPFNEYEIACRSQIRRCPPSSIASQNCSICNILQLYSRQCSINKIDVNWRRSDLCPVQCRGKKVYKECNTKCRKTCENVHQKSNCVQTPCINGCFCPEGTVLHKENCISVSDCPCTHKDKNYKKGDTIKKDCNTCKCLNGQWDCTKHPCSATCSVYGDPHYKTFDGKIYNFNGICNYMLAKDCKTNSFYVTTENVACSTFSDVSCTRSAKVYLNNSIIALNQGGQVLVDSKLVMLPYVQSGVLIKQVSSIFIKLVASIGIELLFDGRSKIYLTVNPSFQNKTCGLCGTYNTKQQDDFKTPEGNIDSNAVSFGNTWAIPNQNCLSVTSEKDPCSIQTQKAKIAKKKCNKLKMFPFTKCNDTVDPEPFISACEYDVCGCKNGIECLCNAISAYTKECAENDVVVDWISENIYPECAMTCPPGQIYQECGNVCHRSCRDLSYDIQCDSQCVAGCNCPNNTVLNQFGLCVPISHCPCQMDGNSYPPGSFIYKNKCQKCECKNGKFNCTIDLTKCTLESECPSNQVWRPSGAECLQTCRSLHLPCLNIISAGGCQCPNSTIWDESVLKCVNASECPCHRNGRTYKDGESYKWDCNECKCVGSSWECTANECPGTCSIYGDPHYTTFDGKRYLFEGSCEYVLAQDSCNDDDVGNFSVLAENVLCGSSGSVCTKSITFMVNDTILQLRKDQQTLILPALLYDYEPVTKIEILKSKFYDIIHTGLGITLFWDRNTRILISLDPRYKGRTCGLCGNFNDNQKDDFTTPKKDVVINTEGFGDSWKVKTTCSNTKSLTHPCTVRKDRAPWSYKQCNIINRELFKPCHDVVDPRPYFDACYHDTCGCDIGGDCDCLCTAVAAYAQVCSTFNVHIKWRSQEFCPIQCDTCEEYKACGPSNPRTCKNLCQPILEKFYIDCVEGCFCQNDTVLHNGKCVKSSECACYLDDTPYQPGAFYIKDCETCTCQDGCFKCTGETCTTTTTRPETTLTTSTTTPTTTTSTTEVTTTTTKNPTTTTTTTDALTTSSVTTSTTTPLATAITSSTTSAGSSTTSAGSSTTSAGSSTTSTGSSTTEASTTHVSTTTSSTATTPKQTTTQSATVESTTTSTSPLPTTTTSPVLTTTTTPVLTTTTDIPSTTTETSTTTTTTSTPTTTTSTPEPFVCDVSPQVFACSDKSGCLNATQVCDKNKDCADNSDENGCQQSCAACSKMNFKCHKTCQCISIYFVCDNDPECSDKSDEFGCPSTNTTHPTTTGAHSTTTESPTTSTTISTTPDSITTTTPIIISSSTTTQATTTTATTPTTTTTTIPTTTIASTTPITTTTSTTTPITTTTTTTTTTRAPITCPGNFVYKSCVRTCENKCSYLTLFCVEDSRICRGGCGCLDNLVSNGTACVLPSACACLDLSLNRFYLPNANWDCGCDLCTCFNNEIKRRSKCQKLFCPPPRRLQKLPGECCEKCVNGTLPPTTITPSTTSKTCSSKEFMCHHDQKCIPSEWECDGERDCYDASDERTCSTIKESCFDAIGISYKSIIQDVQLSSSSSVASYYVPKFGRLNYPTVFGVSAGAWCSSYRGPKWIQVDLRSRYLISKVAVQGRYMVVHYVRTYKLFYAVEANEWRYYSVNGASDVKLFTGNNKPNQITTTKLEHKIQARYVRIEIADFERRPCLRFELYGCSNFSAPTTTVPPTTTTTSTTSTTSTTTPRRTTPCPEFSCLDGTCIPNFWVCNGTSECFDGSDEAICNNNTCSNNSFRCASGYCLPSEYRCDGDTDCLEGEDEMNCQNQTCHSDQFQCNNSVCLHQKYICDGTPDCRDGEDEINCTTTTTTAPTTTTTTVSTTTLKTTIKPTTPCSGFLCNKISHQCIPWKYLCDNTKDCLDSGEDEMCCSKQGRHRCSSLSGTILGKCIEDRVLCDGYDDCGDNSDEQNCTTTTTTATTTSASTTTSSTSDRNSTIVYTEPTKTTPKGGHGGCERNSTCVCDNTCGSLASNATGCLSFYCIDECACPDGFFFDNKTKYCQKNITCPCHQDGRIYTTGSIISGRNCTQCFCEDDGFRCVRECRKECPKGEQLVFPQDGCCRCEKEIYCRPGKFKTDCACSLNCSSPVGTACNITTCELGCMCPDGTFDNGTDCVPRDQCYCTDDGGIIRMANSRWENGSCDSCKCIRGNISCRPFCKYASCPSGFSSVTKDDGCCGCVWQTTTTSVPTTTAPTTTTTTTAPTTTTTTTAPTTTTTTTETASQTTESYSNTTISTTQQPFVNCSIRERLERFTDNENCSLSVGKSFCQGRCLSSIVSDFMLGVGIQTCTCCKPVGIYNHTVSLQCPNGSTKKFTFQKFNECNCQPCDNSPFNDVTLFKP